MHLRGVGSRHRENATVVPQSSEKAVLTSSLILKSLGDDDEPQILTSFNRTDSGIYPKG